MMTVVYYIPIWFQAIQGQSAVHAGLRTLGLILPLVISSILAGQITHRTGYYVPQMIASSIIMSVGAGMLTTWDVDTPRAKWIGYQVIYGFGIGLGMQQPNMAIQTVLPRKDIPTGTALVFFTQTLGGSLFVSVAQNIFASRLGHYLRGIPGLDVPALFNAGATGLRELVRGSDILRVVLEAYNKALSKTFVVGAAVSCAGIVGALAMEWRTIRDGEGQGETKKEKKPDAEEKVRGSKT